MPPDAAPDPALNAEPKLPEVVAAIAAQLDPDRIGTGPLAALRRLDRGGTLAEPALQRILCRHVADEQLNHRSGMQFWALLIHAMALAAPDGHRAQGPAGRLGTALFEAGYSEGRLLRLLESRPEDLPVAVPRAVRFLVAKGQAFSSVSLAFWLRGMFAGGSSAERQRTDAARDYYRAEREASKPVKAP